MPEQRASGLEDLACLVIEKSSALLAKVREPLRRDLVEVTRWMHCYYSNLIEGQHTSVRDIEAALKKDFSAQPERRNMQLLALAHLEAQNWAASYDGSPFAPEFLRELHRRFYAKLPPELCVATTSSGQSIPLEPGELRTRDVAVGDHVGPPHEIVPELLGHFRRRYEQDVASRPRRIIAVGASHHRLAWIHPFRDGNGRVVRLFSDCLFRDLGVDAGGLWSLSRGLAIHRTDYYARLGNADQERSATNPDDGSGHLSGRALRDFCEFILNVMVDQITFMDRLVDLDRLCRRIEEHVHFHEDFGRETERVFFLLREALYRGKFPRGEAGRIVGASDRTGRLILSRAEKAGLLKSETPKSPVSLGLPVRVLGSYFPQLFPPDQVGNARQRN